MNFKKGQKIIKKKKENNCQYTNSIAAIVSQIISSVHNFSKQNEKKN